MTGNSKVNKTPKKSQTDLEKELLAMKKELAFRQEEIEILKKAAVLNKRYELRYFT